MTAGADAPPEGYVRLTAGPWHAMARDWAAAAVGAALRHSTLHEWAAAQPDREVLRGRGPAYATTLPAGAAPAVSTPVVVRRNRHGGLLRVLTGELFLKPTRAPHELAVSARLVAAGIPTPEVVACAVYPAAGLLARSDVMTRRLPEGNDLPAAWRNGDAAARHSLLAAVAVLLRALGQVGAWHPDLNLKNICLTGRAPAMTAYVLDVDRVNFCPAAEAARLNFERLARSARKWRERWGLDLGEDALAQLAPGGKEAA